VVVAPGATGIEGLPGGEPRVALAPPSPNPSRGDVVVRLHLASASPVEVALFDLRGRRVRTLFGGSLAAGEHAWHWDGRTAEGAAAAAGVYLCEARAGGVRAHCLMVRLP
jgi:hypothetical protein